jgi:hypothetical protein
MTDAEEGTRKIVTLLGLKTADQVVVLNKPASEFLLKGLTSAALESFVPKIAGDKDPF